MSIRESLCTQKKLGLPIRESSCTQKKKKKIQKCLSLLFFVPSSHFLDGESNNKRGSEGLCYYQTK